jgi:hypothetical protein
MTHTPHRPIAPLVQALPACAVLCVALQPSPMPCGRAVPGRLMLRLHSSLCENELFCALLPTAGG